MLGLMRYLDHELSDEQCEVACQQNYEWDPVRCLPIDPNGISSRALKTVCSMRSSRKPQQRSKTQRYGSLGGRVWFPLPNQDPRENQSWRINECGGGGDCLFHSIAYALRISMLEVRKMVADAVNNANIDDLLTYYTEVYPVLHVTAAMRKSPTRTSMFKQLISTPGPAYMGDDTSLRLLVSQPANRVGFIIFNSTGELHGQVFLSKHVQQMVILYHTPGHWQLVGHVLPNDPFHRVQLTFDPFQLPGFLTQKLAALGVNVTKEFATWEPRLELERKKVETKSLSARDGVLQVQ